MKHLALFCLFVAGCGHKPPPPAVPTVVAQPKPAEKPAEIAHWRHSPEYGGNEDWYLIRDSDGQVLIDIIHGSGPNEMWDVCRGDGSCYRDYETAQEAKAGALTQVNVEVRP